MSDEQPQTEASSETGEAKSPDARKRILYGFVVSNKMEKTIVVQVTRRYRHPRYKKYVNERVRYKAHDEENTAREGDRVTIIESRPLSRDKRWRLHEVLERAPIV